MSSPLITVTTAGLSFSLVIANDATCVAAPLSSPEISELGSGSDVIGGGVCAFAVAVAEDSGAGSAFPSLWAEPSTGATNPPCALALAPITLIRTNAVADHAVRSRCVIIS